jgi:hypothetical protein
MSDWHIFFFFIAIFDLFKDVKKIRLFRDSS